MNQRPRQLSKPITTSEILEALRSRAAGNPKAAERESRRDAHRAKYMADCRPLMDELRGQGYVFETPDDLRRSGVKYTTAVGTLVRWLGLIDDLEIKADIVHALSVPWAAGEASAVLLQEFHRADGFRNQNYRWAVGSALGDIASEAIATELIAIATDARFGSARQMIVIGLGRLKKSRPVAQLVQLLTDEIVAPHAISAIAKLNATEAVESIRPLQGHSNPLIAKSARAAVRKLSKLQDRRKQSELV